MDSPVPPAALGNTNPLKLHKFRENLIYNSARILITRLEDTKTDESNDSDNSGTITKVKPDRNALLCY